MNRMNLMVRRFIVGLLVIAGLAAGSVVATAPAQAAANGWVTACFRFAPAYGGKVWTGAQTAMTYHGNLPHYSQPQYSANGCTMWTVPGNLWTAVNAAYTPGNGYRKWYAQTAPTYIPAGRHYHLGWTLVYPKYP